MRGATCSTATRPAIPAKSTSPRTGNDAGQPVLYFPPLDSGLVSLMSQLAYISGKALPQTKANSGAVAAAGVAQTAAPIARAAAVVALAAGGNGRC